MLNYWVSKDTETIDTTNKTNKYHTAGGTNMIIKRMSLMYSVY